MIKRARYRKPKGIFLVEFLAPERLSVYRKLLELRRKHDKIKKIQVRGGNVHYKIESQDSFLRLDTLDEVRALGEKLAVADDSDVGESSEQY